VIVRGLILDNGNKFILNHEGQYQLDLLDVSTDGASTDKAASSQLPPAGNGRTESLRICYKDFGAMTFSDYEIFSKIPVHPFWSQVEQLIDFSFADELCAHLYSPNGQRPYAPSLKLKIHLVQTYYVLSDRDMEERMLYDIAIKRFLGVPMSFTGFDHSTIGLDRERMGSDLFHACFHHILAQAKQYELWGGENDRWLVDAFHTHARVSRVGAYRLIMQAVLRIFQHMKRAHPKLYQMAEKNLRFKPWFQRLSPDSTPEERMVAFSQLVVRAYSLLSWFESEAVLSEPWPKAKRKHRSAELQTILLTILKQYAQPGEPPDSSPTHSVKGSSDIEEKKYVKIPLKDRPRNRIISANDPDVRGGRKSTTVKFTGEKVQVVEDSSSHFILEVEPIPGNESDGQRLKELVESIISHHEIKPKEVIADTTYGTGRNRALLAAEQIALCSPVPPWSIHQDYSPMSISPTTPKNSRSPVLTS
jgi:transposase